MEFEMSEAQLKKKERIVLEYIKNDIKVEWDDIGEGRYGDYNPEDPHDEPLLRFYISLRDFSGKWLDMESRCTYFPVHSSDDLKEKALRFIYDQVKQPLLDHLAKAREGSVFLSDGVSPIKRLADKLSWISPEWFDGTSKKP